LKEHGRRLAWFGALWVASVATTLGMALLLKLFFGAVLP
jgi:hypothetical protein